MVHACIETAARARAGPDREAGRGYWRGGGFRAEGVAAADLGVRFVGIEREPNYFDIACERIARAQAHGQLLPHDAAPLVEQAAMTLDL